MKYYNPYDNGTPSTSGASDVEPYVRSFGDGTTTTFTLAHTKSQPSDASVWVGVGARKVKVGIDVDYMSTPNQVTIGPFAQAPTFNQYTVVIEGIT